MLFLAMVHPVDVYKFQTKMTHSYVVFNAAKIASNDLYFKTKPRSFRIDGIRCVCVKPSISCMKKKD